MPPQTGSDLVVSHHLAGFGSLQVPGLLHPGTGQDSLRFRSRATRCPKTPARHVPSPAARSHPSKSSPRWQPCRITTAVAPSAFTRRACLSSTSRSSRRSLVSIRWTLRVSEDPHPSHRKVAPSVPGGGMARLGPPTVWTTRTGKVRGLPRSHCRTHSASVHRRISSAMSLEPRLRAAALTRWARPRLSPGVDLERSMAPRSPTGQSQTSLLVTRVQEGCPP